MFYILFLLAINEFYAQDICNKFVDFFISYELEEYFNATQEQKQPSGMLNT